MPKMVPFTSFRVTVFSFRVTVFTLFLVSSAAAQQSTPGPRDVVQSAERSVQDDSVAAVRARWTEALRRDSTDRAAALGLASLARLTYDFATAERLLNGMLARAGGTVDPWTVQATIGLYRVANASGEHHPRRFPAQRRRPRGASYRRPRRRARCADRPERDPGLERPG